MRHFCSLELFYYQTDSYTLSSFRMFLALRHIFGIIVLFEVPLQKSSILFGTFHEFPLPSTHNQSFIVEWTAVFLNFHNTHWSHFRKTFPGRMSEQILMNFWHLQTFSHYSKPCPKTSQIILVLSKNFSDYPRLFEVTVTLIHANSPHTIY